MGSELLNYWPRAVDDRARAAKAAMPPRTKPGNDPSDAERRLDNS
jgi:hypothetical protein